MFPFIEFECSLINLTNSPRIHYNTTTKRTRSIHRCIDSNARKVERNVGYESGFRVRMRKFQLSTVTSRKYRHSLFIIIGSTLSKVVVSPNVRVRHRRNEVFGNLVVVFRFDHNLGVAQRLPCSIISRGEPCLDVKVGMVVEIHDVHYRARRLRESDASLRNGMSCLP